MNTIKNEIPSSTGQTLRLVEWMPDNSKAIVQIIHGMAEHIDRYEDFAAFLTGHGYGVVGNNHAGHGETASIKGYFAEKDGWKKVVEDIHQVRLRLQKEYPDLPYFMFGHSMGSFLLRTYLQDHSDGLAGAIVCGTGQQPTAMLAIGSLIAGIQSLFGGAKKPCRLLNMISSKQFAATVPEYKTTFDWLTRDEKIVQQYIDDDYCGFPFTASAYLDLFHGFRSIVDGSRYAHSNKELPLFLIAGQSDPVGEMGKMVIYVEELLKNWGFQNVSRKFYPQARHELTNELNRQEVYEDILEFLERWIPC